MPLENQSKLPPQIAGVWYIYTMFDYSLQIGEGGTIRVPDDVLQHYDLHPGDRLQLRERPDGVIEIRAMNRDEHDLDFWIEEDFSSDEVQVSRSDGFAAESE